MPLPSASKLYYPYPKPTTPEEHAVNLQQQASWSERLPFFGPSASYHVFPDTLTSTTATTFPNPILTQFTDYESVAAFPYSGGANGLYFPYQKQEDWTAIRVDIQFSCFGNTGAYLAGFSRLMVSWLFVQPIEYFTSGFSSKPQIPPDQSGNPDGLRSIRGMFINPALVHLPVTDTLIIPPHQRGVWAAQFHWYLFAGAGSAVAMDSNDRWRVVITECPPPLPPYAGEVP
jgi:hypothetical protein